MKTQSRTETAAHITAERRTVRGSIRQGRRPYLQIDCMEYRGVQLSARPDLINKSVIVHINELDMRSCDMYTEDGVFIGTAYASWSAGTQPYTREQTKALSAPRSSASALRITHEAECAAALHEHLAKNTGGQGAPGRTSRRLRRRASGGAGEI